MTFDLPLSSSKEQTDLAQQMPLKPPSEKNHNSYTK